MRYFIYKEGKCGPLRFPYFITRGKEYGTLGSHFIDVAATLRSARKIVKKDAEKQARKKKEKVPVEVIDV